MTAVKTLAAGVMEIAAADGDNVFSARVSVVILAAPLPVAGF